MDQIGLTFMVKCMLNILYMYLVLPVKGTAIEYIPNDRLCDEIGGECMNTFGNGCKDGSFRRGVCAGPNYRHCCVPNHPWTDPKDLIPAFRMCYTCEYAHSNGNISGDPWCQDEFPSHPHMIEQVNCTGQCAKHWLQLDEETFSITRECNIDCHPTTTFENYASYCCWGELCNKSSIPEIQLKPLILFLFINVILSE